MTQISTFEAQPRERAGKGAARTTRNSGLVPAVIYGDKKPPQMIALTPKALLSEMSRTGFRTRLFDIKVGAETHRCLARDVQTHPVTDRPLHVDFMRVGKDSVIHVGVPVIFMNDTKSPGIKRGGVLNVVRHEVELVCRPDNIPEKLVVDLTGLDIGDSVHISHIKLPEGVRPFITDRDFTVATVAPPTLMKTPEQQAAEDAAAAAAATAAAGAAAAAGTAAPAAGAKGSAPGQAAPAAGAKGAAPAAPAAKGGGKK
ncbi:MAG: 50S ribosomal protein L25/general stress protein Ctc [Rhodospirillales bacterium]|nr:50S ribosomal protein L25/general stress protein Ctc [Rhodospirillales bacterium]